MDQSAIKYFHRDFTLFSLFRVITQRKEKVNRGAVRKINPSFPLYSYFLSSHSFNFLFSFLLLLPLIHLLSFPVFPPSFQCVPFPLLSFSPFRSPLHPSDSPLSTQKPFLNSSVRSDPFHQPEKANYLPFYDFHYFTTHTVFYYWAVGSQH